MIRLEIVRSDQRELLWNIHQKYLYEMTNFYPDEMDAAGNYEYGYFDAYFTDSRRTALLIYDGDALAGFAMLNPYSYFDRCPDHVMAEFTVFPAFRRRHIALDAAREILRRYPGCWEIKYNEQNLPAKTLWNRLAAPYNPEKRALGEGETVLCFSTK